MLTIINNLLSFTLWYCSPASFIPRTPPSWNHVTTRVRLPKAQRHQSNKPHILKINGRSIYLSYPPWTLLNNTVLRLGLAFCAVFVKLLSPIPCIFCLPFQFFTLYFFVFFSQLCICCLKSFGLYKGWPWNLNIVHTVHTIPQYGHK